MKSKLLIWLLLFTLPALACGVQTAPALKAESAIISESTPAVRQPVLMVVVAEKGVNVRSMPSENASYTREALEFGDMVTVDEVKMIGDSNWCHHQFGWSNCKWLKALEAVR